MESPGGSPARQRNIRFSSGAACDSGSLGRSRELGSPAQAADGAPRSHPTNSSFNPAFDSRQSQEDMSKEPQLQQRRHPAAGRAKDAVLMSRQELEDMISFETNNLYEYLRGLYSHGLEEAQAGHEFDKEAWDRRMGQLRSLLQQRDAEVQELQQALEERDGQLDVQDDRILQQAEVIRSQAAQIRQLLSAELQRQEDCRYVADEEPDALEASPLSYKRKVAMPQIAVQAESHYVQLPPQQTNCLSYQEYQGCGFWQALFDSLLTHRKRWIAGGAAALLLLLIILLATLIPASKRKKDPGPAAPQFLQAPVIAATGATFFDISVQLDQPAIISYMVFPTSNELQQGGKDRVVASTPDGAAVSSVQVLNSVARATAVNFFTNDADEPYLSNMTSNAFVLNIQLRKPGTVFYAVMHASMYTQYGPYNLAFESLEPSSSDVLEANTASFTGGLVANGTFSVDAANEWAIVRIQPPCAGSLCQQSVYGLLGGTSYKVFMVSKDLQGNLDPSPLMLPLTTAPDTTAPALLPASGPASITATSFGYSLSMDAAGGAYYMLLVAKPTAGLAAPQVDAGKWTSIASLPTASSGNRRRQLRGAVECAACEASEAGEADFPGRRLLAGASGTTNPGSLVFPTCYPANISCLSTPASIFSRVPGLAGFDVVASGCTPVPAASQAVSLPAFTGLTNNTVYYLLLATEDRLVPSPNIQSAPEMYAVKTVDLSAAKFACGFPTVTNITSSGFAVSAMVTKQAWAFFVVLPTSQVATAPSATDILQGQGSSGQSVAAAGNMTRAGALPWEAGDAKDTRKLWASVSGLQSGVSYTAFVTLSMDGNSPLPGAQVVRISDIYTPATVAPTFTTLTAASMAVDESLGTFSVRINATLDRAGVVYYSMYRTYSCVSGDPSISDILAANPLPAGICPCSESWYCSNVVAGNLSTSSPAQPASGIVTGNLAPLPFESLRTAPQSELKCFRGGLGQASDTYNASLYATHIFLKAAEWDTTIAHVYLVAGTSLPTYTGLAPQCSNFGQAAATAAAGDTLASSDGSCPSFSAIISCSQAQVKPDVRIMQSGTIQAWNQQAGGASSNTSWQPASGANVYGRPARVQLSFESGVPPSFTSGPDFPTGQQLTDGLFMQFNLSKPALVIYSVRSLPVFDPATGDFPAPVLVATGRTLPPRQHPEHCAMAALGIFGREDEWQEVLLRADRESHGLKD
ncbi:hypothetical protein N2152v2_007941 [Parachlorella kessleri]